MSFGDLEHPAAVEEWIHASMRAQREDEQRKRIEARGDKKPNPYISSMGKQCRRAVWLEMHGPDPTPPDFAAMVVFEMGHIAEEYFAKVLFGEQVRRELRVELPAGDTIVSGRADFLVGNRIVELKTIGGRQYEYMLDRSEPGRTEHRKQLNGYLHAAHLGLLSYEDGDSVVTVPPQEFGWLVYVNKDPDWKNKHYHRPMAAFKVPYAPETAETDLQRLAEIAAGADPGTAGRRADAFPCGSPLNGGIKTWCGFYEYCWAKEEG